MIIFKKIRIADHLCEVEVFLRRIQKKHNFFTINPPHYEYRFIIKEDFSSY